MTELDRVEVYIRMLSKSAKLVTRWDIKAFDKLVLAVYKDFLIRENESIEKQVEKFIKESQNAL